MQQLASIASNPNSVQCSTSDVRTLALALTTASSAIGAISTSPNTKPPCRLAHSTISGSNQNDGARRRAAAAINPPTHSTITGIASTCGRASRCGTVSASAPATNTRVVLSLSRRFRNLASSANVAAMALAASTTGPVQPATA